MRRGGEGNYTLNELNGCLGVHSEIDESPVDPFFLVLLLLEGEHVVVEELLQLLVGEIDAKLKINIWIINK
jgi:hypothetical protein